MTQSVTEAGSKPYERTQMQLLCESLLNLSQRVRKPLLQAVEGLAKPVNVSQIDDVTLAKVPVSMEFDRYFSFHNMHFWLTGDDRHREVLFMAISPGQYPPVFLENHRPFQGTMVKIFGLDTPLGQVIAQLFEKILPPGLNYFKLEGENFFVRADGPYHARAKDRLHEIINGPKSVVVDGLGLVEVDRHIKAMGRLREWFHYVTKDGIDYVKSFENNTTIFKFPDAR